MTIGHTVSLMSTMSHEMAHYRQWSLGKKISHGRDFRAMQKVICAAHGFDPKVF
jgi:predicted SprT family Zn-dependent metalloprotease